MKKMSILLNDLTILNFPLLGKLFMRYLKINIAVIILIVIVSFYNFLAQNEIFRTSVEFKNVSGTNNSPTSSLAVLLGENNSGLSATEVVGIGQSLDFHQRMAIELYNDPDFADLNFNNPRGKSNFTNKEMFANCKGNQECHLSILRGAIPALYEIRQNNEVRTKYIVSVMAMNALTAQKLLEKIKKVIVADRIESIKHSLSEQRKISQSLVREKRSELERFNLGAISFKNRALDLQLEEINSSAKNFNSLLGMMSQKLGHTEAKYLQTKQTLKNSLTDQELEEFKQVSELRDRISLLQKNIHKLKIAEESDDIINKLEDELELAKTQLEGFGDISKYEGDYEQFIEERNQNSRSEHFNYNVIMSEVEAFKANYLKMLDSKKSLIREKLDTEKKLEALQPSFEYLKLLQGQSAKLKLLESTVVSDLVFDKFSTPVSRYKRATIAKTMLFGILMTIFLLVSIIIIRYRFDAVVLDELELIYNYNDLSFLGASPKFSKE